MSPVVRRAVWFACGLAVAVVVAWALVRGDTDVPQAPPADEGSSVAVVAPATSPRSGPEPWASLPTPVPKLQSPSLHEVLRLCPVFWQDATEFTAECMAALDGRYSDRSVDEGNGYPRVADSLTWRSVFEDASRTRNSVVEALRKPDCRVPDGFVRPELRESCAADDMARLAVLQQECGKVLTLDDDYGGAHDNDWEWELDRVARQASDQEDYYRRRSSATDMQLRYAWQLRRCRAARAGVDWIDSLPIPSGGIADYDQHWHLNRAAARLGSQRAMLAYWNILEPR